MRKVLTCRRPSPNITIILGFRVTPGRDTSMTEPFNRAGDPRLVADAHQSASRPRKEHFQHIKLKCAQNHNQQRWLAKIYVITVTHWWMTEAEHPRLLTTTASRLQAFSSMKNTKVSTFSSKGVSLTMFRC